MNVSSVVDILQSSLRDRDGQALYLQKSWRAASKWSVYFYQLKEIDEKVMAILSNIFLYNKQKNEMHKNYFSLESGTNSDQTMES